MNEVLKEIGELPLRIPTCFAKRTERRKEIMVMNDLRCLEENGLKKFFRMFPRRNAMDLAHGILVLEELARYHASSLLYEDKLGKKIDEVFPYFEVSIANTIPKY